MERKLLIVEDDPLMQEAVADYFVSKGWLVQMADNGEDALELLEQNSFHLLLLDVMMPGNPKKQRHPHYFYYGKGYGRG